MDILSLAVGFGIGVVVVAIAIEFGTKKTKEIMPSSRRTVEWNINEIQNPKVMAEYLGDIAIPSQSKVLVNKYRDIDQLKGLNVKRSTMIKGNYILGDDRALILSGPLRDDEAAFWTVEEEIVKKLNQEFNELWINANRIEFKDDNK